MTLKPGRERHKREIGRGYREWSRQHKRSSDVPSLPSKTFIHPAEAIIRDSTHPAHQLFNLLPSGRRYRSIRIRTNRFRNARTHAHTHTSQGQCAIIVKHCTYLSIYLILLTLHYCLVLFTLFLCCVNTWMLLEFRCTLCNDNKRIMILIL